MKRLPFLALFLGTLFNLIPSTAAAVDAFYLGGQVGHVGLTGTAASTFSNAIGFGIDLGVRTNPLLDVVLSVQRSGHSGGGAGGLTLFSQTLSADFHFGEFNDFEFSLGGGPGFYFFKTDPQTDTNFGLNLGSNVDVIVDEQIRVGLGFRWHAVFSGGIGSSYWTAMMRVGYLFAVK